MPQSGQTALSFSHYLLIQRWAEIVAKPTQLQLLLCKTAKAVLLQTDLLACGK